MKSKKSLVVRLIVCAVILAALIPLGFVTKVFDDIDFSNLFKASTLLKLVIMIAAVLIVETIIVAILSVPKPKSHRARSILSVVSSLMKYVAAIVILCWGLSIIGVNVSTIVASVGILALVIGFSAESLISDVITGAFMIFENNYNVGDIVEVDGFRGTVTSIGIRTTCITDAVDNVRIVNNSSMKNLLNRSDKMSYSIIDIGIPYETRLEEIEKRFPEMLKTIYEDEKETFKAVPEYYGVQALADSSVVLRFAVQVEEKDIYRGARKLNRAVWLGMRSIGVECPFPQVDVHSK